MANCPKCGKPLKYQLRSAGTTTKTRYYRTGVKKSWLVPSGRKKYQSQRNTYMASYCPNCGYQPPSEIHGNKGCSSRVLTVLGILVLLGVVGNVIRGNGSDNKKSQVTTPPAKQAVQTIKGNEINDEKSAVLIDTPIPSSAATKEKEKTLAVLETVIPTQVPTATPVPESVWAQEPTPISEFEYYLDGDYIYLTDWEGDRNSKILLAESYIVDGKKYKIGKDLMDLQFHSITSAIIPEGVEHIKNSMFNSCGIKYLYLPKSLKFEDSNPYFFSYFHNLEKLYYGGSEEEWKKLIGNLKRKDIDVKHVVYNATISDLVFEYSADSVGLSQITEQKTPQNIWATEYTSLDDFDFYVDGDYIILKKYIGKGDKVWLAREYDYEGKRYTVSDTYERYIRFDNAMSIIIADGYRALSGSMFSSRNLKYVYVPRSITAKGADGFFKNFNNVEKLYYGGSEQEWDLLTAGLERRKVKVKQIFFNMDYDTFIEFK